MRIKRLFPIVCTALVLLSGSHWSAGVAAAQTTSDELSRLREEMANQQQQIRELRKALDEQRQMLQGVMPSAVQPGPAPSPSQPAGPVTAANPIAGCQVAPDGKKPGSLCFKVGGVEFTPLGFMDFTYVGRSTDVGSGLGTGFGGIPLSNVAAGQLSETRLSVQNSRVGMKAEGNVGNARLTGYLEADFLGNAPGNLAVTSNADTMRLRLYWAQLKYKKFEFLAGQSWSLLTPSRKGISPMPSDIFYSQDVDTNYQVGLTWARQSQLRMVFKPNEHISAAISFENPQQYVGGAVTLPTYYVNQLEDGTRFATPNLTPDIIAKVAFDGDISGKHQHIEVQGLQSTFRDVSPTGQHVTKAGGGGGAGFNFEVAKGSLGGSSSVHSVSLIANGFASSGGGRYVFGLAPDLIVRPDGNISLVHVANGTAGIEWKINTAKDYKSDYFGGDKTRTLFYAYYGGVYIGRNTALDGKGGSFGYGLPGATGANRAIQEATFGVSQAFFANRLGTLKLMTQYSYLTRNPWSVPAGNPTSATTNMVFVNLRYELP